VNYKTGGSHCAIDCGCTQHMTSNPRMFTSLDEDVDEQDKITFGDNSKGKVQGLGVTPVSKGRAGCIAYVCQDLFPHIC
jgi:hypothetical protein